jgi:hypothetical protein
VFKDNGNNNDDNGNFNDNFNAFGKKNIIFNDNDNFNAFGIVKDCGFNSSTRKIFQNFY